MSHKKQSRTCLGRDIEMTPETKRAASPSELDALVGVHITRDDPDIYWEDSHGHFQFDTELEARRALSDPYYQRFLPDVDWSHTVVREVRRYSPYCTDSAANWALVEKASAQFGSMLVWRERGYWHAAFGTHPDAEARTPLVAICLAALRAGGVPVDVYHDRIDAQINTAYTFEQNGSTNHEN